MFLNKSGVVVAYVVGIAALAIGANAQGQSGRATRPGSEGGQADAGTGRWGLLRGRVIFDGQPPEPRIVADPEEQIAPRDHRGGLIADAPTRRLRDHEVIAGRGEAVRSERLLVDAQTRGVRNALVYIVRPTAIRDEARRAAPSTLRFRADRGVFVPHVLAAMQGAEIQVSTDDPVVYQVRVQQPKAEFLVEENDSLVERPRVHPLHDGMNALFGEYRDGRRVSLNVRPKAGNARPMPIAEDLHPWMSAWWLILDHPYFAVTDGQGAFEIRDVPTGPQWVVVWQESVDPIGKVFEGEVAIRVDGETVKDYLIEPVKVRAANRATSRQ